jgi:ribosomal protein S18 acetylase RimI-like enzyme
MKIKLLKLNKNTENKINRHAKIYLKEITSKKNINLHFLNKFTEVLKSKTKFLWIHDNKEIVGFVSMYFNKKPINSCYIRDFYIKKKCRGKLLGTNVFKKILNICKKKKIKRIKIDVLQSNKKIENFWLSIGFKKKIKSYYYKINNDRY